MKTRTIRTAIAAAVAGALTLAAGSAPAQEAAGTNVAPQLPYGVTQVLQLEQAKVGDAAIISFIRSSGHTYPLDAAQIIYLRQQGVSDAVLTAMLSQPKASAAPAVAPPPPPPAPQPATPTPPPTTTVVQAPPAAPTVTYVQPAPPTVYYYPPYYYPAYPYYTWPRPAVGVGVGWGWRGGVRVGVRF